MTREGRATPALCTAEPTDKAPPFKAGSFTVDPTITTLAGVRRAARPCHSIDTPREAISGVLEARDAKDWHEAESALVVMLLMHGGIDLFDELNDPNDEFGWLRERIAEAMLREILRRHP